MEISPIKIFYMAVASFLFGMCAGGLNDINRLVRIFFGARYGKSRLEGLYNIRLPICKKSVGLPKNEGLSKKLLSCVIFVQDILLFSFSGAGVAVLNYYFNNGRARLYTPAAVILGFVIYYFTVGRLVLYFSDGIVFIIKAFFMIIFELFCYPVRVFVRIFGIFAKKICTNLYKTIAKNQKKVYNKSKKNFVMTNAAEGFVDLTKE